MNYTEPFLRKVETAQEEQQHQHQSGVSCRAAVAVNNGEAGIFCANTHFF